MANKNLKSIIKDWSFSIVLTGILAGLAYTEVNCNTNPEINHKPRYHWHYRA